MRARRAIQSLWFSSEQVLQLDARIRFFIPVFHDYRRVERYAPLLTLPAGDRARSGDHDGPLRNHQRFFALSRDDDAASNVIYRSRASQDHATSQNRSAFDHGTFVDSAVPADEH